MMLRLTFKTPDALERAIERLELPEEEAEEILAKANKWIQWGEYITLDLDLETGDAHVHHAKNY